MFFISLVVLQLVRRLVQHASKLANGTVSFDLPASKSSSVKQNARGENKTVVSEAFVNILAYS